MLRKRGERLLIAQRYEVEGEIARSPGARVLLARDLAASRLVAVKILDGKDPSDASLSRNEFARLSGLSHPNLVQLFDIGRDPETDAPFLVMEFVEGVPLARALGAADEPRVLAHLIQAARALAFVHSRGLLHRDLKPANILVRPDGVLKLVDFGLAARIAPEASAPAGTLVYLPPEVIEGRAPDVRSDLYSLGLSFYHAATGCPPFGAPSTSQILTQIVHGAFPPEGAPPLPAILGGAIARLCARRPEDRFSCAGDLIRHLDLAVGGTPAVESAETTRSYLDAPATVGRSREEARLAAAISALTGDDPAADSSLLTLVGGEAGIGKTRLLADLRRRAVLAGLDTLLIPCSETSSAPLHPFTLAVRALSPGAKPATAATDGAAQLLRLLLKTTAVGGEDAEAPERRMAREKSRLFDLLAAYLVAAAAARPLILILEDIHWADGLTLEFLPYLARFAAESRLRIIASHRTEGETCEEFAAWLATTDRREWCERITLERLGDADIHQILSLLFENADVDASLVRTLTRESGGNPFFLVEILRSLQSEKLLERTDSGWRLPEPEEIRSAIPDNLDRALEQRLGDVSAVEAKLLGALAVMGRPLGPETVAELSSLPVDQASEALEVLADRGLLARSAWAGGRFSFVHALIRRAAEERLEPELRDSLHRRAGEIIERDAPEAPGAIEEIALHLSIGGPAERAAIYAERAGDRALARHAGAEAARHFESALALGPSGKAAADAALRLKAGNARLAAGDHARARAHFETLLELTEGLTDTSLRARALERLGTVLGFQKTGEEGVPLVNEALALFRQLGDLAGEARALHNLAIRLARQSRYAEALPLFHAALEVHERRGDAAAIADERNSAGLVECFLGRYETAADHLERAFDLAKSVDYRYLMGAARHNLGIVRRSQGRPEDALASAREALAIFDEIGHRSAYGLAVINVGLYCRACGRFEEALETFPRARRAVARAGDTSREVYALESEADLLRFLGQPLAAVDRLGEAIRVATRAADERQRGYATAAISRALIDSGRPKEAVERARAALAIGERIASPRLVARSLVALAAAHLASGEPAEGAARARELLARSSSDFPLEEMAAEANLVLAAAQLEMSDCDGARASVQDARRAIESRALLVLAPLADRIEARIARTLRDEALARTLDRRAADRRRALAERIGEETLRRSFESAVTFEWPKELSGVGPGSPSGTNALTALRTLYEITGLVCSGHPLDEILDRVLDLTLEAIAAARGLIILVDQDGTPRVRTSRGVEKQTARDATRYSRSIVKAAGSGQSILTLDAQNDDRFSSFRSISLFQIKSLMCVPLRVRDRIIGTVYVDGGRGGRIFTTDDLSFLEAFAAQAAIAIENARMYAEVTEENQRLKRAAQERYRFDNFVGKSPAMLKVFDLMERAAAAPLPVLIQGESGTGKELVARALHFNSPRRSRVFLSENCAAIPEALLESELFGYVQGAFTGADRDKKGLYEMADGGTLFLDEVGEMPMGMQAKLLRVLQEGEFRPVGAKSVRRANVRIIAATNAELPRRIEEGRFRQDLYYRLNVISIVLPPLRTRREDIPLLAKFFLEKEGTRGSHRLTIEDDLLALLVRYSWPGNVRQLENAIARLAVLARSSRLTSRDLELDPQLFEQLTELDTGIGAVEDLETIEKRQILRALGETSGNREKAAKLLGIGRATIFRKIREYGIS